MSGIRSYCSTDFFHMTSVNSGKDALTGCHCTANSKLHQDFFPSVIWAQYILLSIYSPMPPTKPTGYSSSNRRLRPNSVSFFFDLHQAGHAEVFNTHQLGLGLEAEIAD